MEEISLEEKKKIILDIMSDIDEFCRENDIPYTLCSGTLLGAVRHGGFIPWDDDADIFMLREDFDRFIKSYKGRKYNLLYNTDNGKEFFKEGYAKVSDPSTIALKKNSMARYGVYVDLFPLDHVPEDQKERDDFMDRLIRLQYHLRHRQKKDFLSIITSYWLLVDRWWKKCDMKIRRSGYKDSPLVAHIMGSRNKRTVINKDRFANLTDIEFEGRKFKAFSDPASYLTMVYGDFMTPPPIEDRESHHIRERFYKD